MLSFSHWRLEPERGATMVEFAFAAFWFFMLLVVVMESSVLGWRALTAQYIASNTVREVALYAGNEGAGNANVAIMKDSARELAKSLGLRVTDPAPDPYKLDRDNCEIYKLQSWWPKTYLPWVQYWHTYCGSLPPPPAAEWNKNVQICAIGDVITDPGNAKFGECKAGTQGFGDANGFVVVRVVLPTRYFFQRMMLPVVGEAAARNEK